VRITFKPLTPFKVPVDLSPITPDNLDGMDIGEVKSLQIWVGSKRKRIDELFLVELSEDVGEEVSIVFMGDFGKARGIGSGMSRGSITVKGSGGLRVGECMRGGTIVVEGDVDHWLGMAMRGGSIHVKGSAGSYVGAPPKGSSKGMRGGSIVIDGDAGECIGVYMRDGSIEVKGSVGLFPGLRMLGGTIVVYGDCMGRAAARMKDGRVIILGSVGSILPTFQIEEVRPSVRGVRERLEGPFYVFQGDLSEDGRGRLFVSKPSNPELAFFEKLL